MSIMAVILAATMAGAVPGSVIEPATVEGVRHAEELWIKATVSGDTSAIDALLDPDYVSVNASGVPRPRLEVLESTRTYPQRHPGATVGPFPPTSTIQMIGRTAIVRHRGEAELSVDVFYHDGSRWRAWYSQHTPRAKPA
jgi:uncharacterized protein DUF4440